MSSTLTTTELLSHLGELEATTSQREKEQTRIEKEFESANERVQAVLRDKLASLLDNFEGRRSALSREFKEKKQSAKSNYEARSGDVKAEFEDKREQFANHFDEQKDLFKKDLEESKWHTMALAETTKSEAMIRATEKNKQFESSFQNFVNFRQLVRDYFLRFDQVVEDAEIEPTGANIDADPREMAEKRVDDAQKQFDAIKRLPLPQMMGTDRIVLLSIVLAVISTGILLLTTKLGIIGSGVYSVLGAIVVGPILGFIIRKLGQSQLVKHRLPLQKALTEATTAMKQWRAQNKTSARWERSEINRKRREENAEATDRYKSRRAAAKRQMEREIREIEDLYPRKLRDLKNGVETELASFEATYPPQLTELNANFEKSQAEARAEFESASVEIKRKYDESWNALLADYTARIKAVTNNLNAMTEVADRVFPEWKESNFKDWQPPKLPALGVRFGGISVPMDRIAGGVPKDPRIAAVTPKSLELPALFGFSEIGAVVLRADGEARNVAAGVLQSLMLRFLTALPPGKVRFTIIDPVGLGQNFAGFMHLADFDEQMVNHRIWTEANQIDQRLADLTAHMENVIQKYLRNEFKTIQDYNEQAGEIAEPYRVLVVANFPVNFTEQAARRLVSIVSSGARCGVCAIIGIDPKQPMPHGFNLADLQQHAVNLLWKDRKFLWKDPKVERFDLKVDEAAPAELLTDLLHHVGELSKNAGRVEVPFDQIAPKQEEWWTSDSRNVVSIPLGRSGATRIQQLKLGQGTSQHVLIAGKTGSGKSTLLHAMIVSAAIQYSPDEVELYLVDFKKGVEFKCYATYRLPHAKVIAIESEREFGLSVLQKLDAEMRLRGDQFRSTGVQDIGRFRTENPELVMPRILLIVDEFQEFFVEDDRISQDAALLLDRLVRQGRAFGIHILLGSQTLGGVYSLARTTIGQMAVRIALQCTETDAHLILSEDNSAARLLNRPGEAIYNDSNGTVEGNQIFQVVWLPEDRREDFLVRVTELARLHPGAAKKQQIVFEGNIPSDIRKNHLITRVLNESAWKDERNRELSAWFGEAVAIKDPTAATFYRQSGSNVILVGQADESALGIFCASLISLAGQCAPTIDENLSTGTKFFVLDGMGDENPRYGMFNKVAKCLPHTTKVGGWRDVPEVLNELGDEVARRHRDNINDAPDQFLFIYDLQRFRDLRKAEDDFGYMRGGDEDGKAASPAKRFADILRDGPLVGVHTIIWADTYTNLTRSIDRSGMKELGIRVLFQMSTADSSNLVDSPIANKLGVHRALMAHEQAGRIEKFRPYSVPPEDYLTMVKHRLAERPLPTASVEPTPDVGAEATAAS